MYYLNLLYRGSFVKDYEGKKLKKKILKQVQDDGSAFRMTDRRSG